MAHNKPRERGRPNQLALNVYLFRFQAQANATSVEPGSTISIPFTISSTADGTYTVRVSNDQGYTSSAPTTVTLGDRGTSNFTVELMVPLTVASGSAVTLTVEASNAADVNYAVLRLTVVAKVTLQPKSFMFIQANSCSYGAFQATPNSCFHNLLPVKVPWNGSQTRNSLPMNSYQINVLPAFDLTHTHKQQWRPLLVLSIKIK